MTWLWPSDMESKERFYLVCLLEIYKCLMYIYEYNCMLILLSSPYLLVFDDDRVRGTREQMMLM